MRDEGKVNILLVDDRPDKLLAMEAVLEELNENIVRAYNGREALRCVMNQDFAVILLDVNMPGMDGFETAQLIRQRKNTEHVPIIFVTAYGDDDHRSRGYSLGAVDYIQTPIVPEVLKTKVSVFADLYKKSEQVHRQAHWLRERATQLHKLTEACLLINSALSLDRILRVMTETARDIFGAHVASTILLRDGNWSHPNIVSSASDQSASWWRNRPRPREDGMHGLVCKSNKPMRLSQRELENDYLWHASSQNGGDGHVPTGGWLAAPLTDRNSHNMGLIEVSAKQNGEFTGDDEAILVQLAQMSSVAIVNTIFAEERETNRIKDEFLSTLSHELRTPLHAILGWTQLLGMNSSEKEVSHGLQVIERNAKAQVKLVEDLLDVSRVTTGKLKLKVRPVQLKSIVESAIDAIRPNAKDKQLTMTCSSDVGDGTMLGDPDRLPQVVSNLLGNAVKFTPANGRIDVNLDRQNGSLRLRVSDTGRGIPSAFLPYVFDRFRQADSTSTRTHGGLGIGLTIVRHIVELHGGTVEAQSDGEGRGSTFIVQLPAIEPAKAPADESQLRSSDADMPRVQLQGITILLVDDEADAREVLSNMLASAGADVRSASSVAEAMKLMEESTPHVLISDIAMPDEDGYEFIHRLRLMTGQLSAIPAIAMTAYVRDEDREKALAAGFQLHLAKPIIPMELLLGVQRLAMKNPLQNNAPAAASSANVS